MVGIVIRYLFKNIQIRFYVFPMSTEHLCFNKQHPTVSVEELIMSVFSLRLVKSCFKHLAFFAKS